ncbi:MAG: SDR family oxidoreductase [Alphaproteobacteria bacterium]|nr:SDR family oxidoreductase [Alphaproteobacteria bacterium]
MAIVTDALHFLGTPALLVLRRHGMTVMCQDKTFVEEKARLAFEAEHADAVAASAQEPVALVSETLERLGRIDLIVSNDAFPALRTPIAELKAADLHATYEALVYRPFALASASVPHMRDRRSGKILFVTSAAPLRGLSNYSVYVSARGAINALARSLALELAPHNIQVNAIAPNFIESETYFPKALMADPAAAAKILKNIPLGRLGRPEEAGALIAFLASPEADFITGQVIPLAGGWA